MMRLGVFSIYSISEAAEELLFYWNTRTASTTIKKEKIKTRERKKKKRK